MSIQQKRKLKRKRSRIITYIGCGIFIFIIGLFVFAVFSSIQSKNPGIIIGTIIALVLSCSSAFLPLFELGQSSISKSSGTVGKIVVSLLIIASIIVGTIALIIPLVHYLAK